MTNRLAQETSPYLQQHAENPVDWYPWGPEALERARREDKPILLSIGYSACHWCHVMAHESFEDPAVAAVMNEHFVNVKIDREERPDIDQIYQTAHQMLTQHAGGWPLTMFLTPDQAPFFGGTYYPKTPRHNLPGFVSLMERVLLAYREKRKEINEQNAVIVDAFGRGDQAAEPAAIDTLSTDPIDAGAAALLARFDTEHGGFGEAPKFPHPTELALMLARGAGPAREAALLTLRKMAQGGIFDHLGGGFCRYSVDRYWMIPHFEKMLYDNGPLLALYVDAHRITGEPLFAQAVTETADWMIREMQSPEGGYFSSLDADSEGEEGKFYRWTQLEVRAVLSPAEFAIVEQHYGLVGHANFEGHYWHLNVVQPLAQAAERCGMTLEDASAALAHARATLFTVRERRIRPGRDEKVLTSWNALAIIGMARAGRVFNRPDWSGSARQALRFMRDRLWRDGRLLATFKDDRAHLNAYLDDYAYSIAAVLELAQDEFDPADLDFARALADVLIDQFEDRESGGFYFTSNDHERLIHRPKQGYDNATPSGNGVAAWALTRLGHLLGETRYLESAARTVATFYPSMQAQPAAYGALLAALAEVVSPPTIVVVRGDPSAFPSWRAAMAQAYRPNTFTLMIPNVANHLPAPLNKLAPPAGVNAYVCAGVSCLAPVDSITSLDALIGPSV